MRSPGAVAGLVLAALLVLLSICEAVGWPFLRGPFERQLEQRLQREVTIGDEFQLRLLGSVRLRTDRFTIGPPGWAGGAKQPSEFIDAEGVYLKLPYASLLAQWRHRGEQAPPPLRVRAFEVEAIDATLWRLADGRANWQFGEPAPDRPRRDFEAPEFERLLVGRGDVRYRDAVLQLVLRAQARTDEGSQAGRSARGLVLQGDGTYRKAEFDFRITSSGALPLLAQEGQGEPVPVTASASAGQAKYTFDGRAIDLLRLHGFDGQFSVQGNSLATAGAPWGVTLPTTPAFKLDGQLSKDGQVWKAAVREAAVGTSRLGGQFTFDRRPQVPLLSGKLTGERLVLADLGPAFGAPRGAGSGRQARADGQVLPQREFNLPSLRAMNADVRFDLAMLDLGTAYLRDLRPLQAHVRLQGGVLRIDEVVADTSGGKLRGALVLDSRPAAPRWDVDLQLADVRLEQWLQARNPRDEQAREGARAPAYVTGLMSGRAQFRGVGRSTAAMLGSLDGTASLWINDGELSHLVVEALGIDVAEGLGLLITGDQRLPMRCAVMRFVADGGQLKSELGLIDTPDTLVLVDGSVSLAREQLDLKLMARPKDFSPLSLRSPIHVQGRFADPQVRLDAGRIGLKVLAAAALAAVNPLAAVIPLIDPGAGTSGKQGCGQALQRLRSARTGEPAPPARTP